MATKSNPLFVPPIEKSLLKRLHNPDNWMLDSVAENIDHLNKLLNSIPRNYPWEFMSAEAFQRIGSSLGSATALYRHYWHDMLGQIEAFLGELIYTRVHNADFLQAFGAEIPDILDAAQLLRQASDLYSLTLECLAGNCASGSRGANELIRSAAQAERSAGELLRQCVENGT